MESASSKKQSKQRRELREKLLQTQEGPYRKLSEEQQGQSLRSPEKSDKNSKSPSCKKRNTPRAEKERQQNVNNSNKNNKVKAYVKPNRPLKPITYKLAIDMSHFIKEKGGLKEIYYSIKKHRY
uniref:Protein Nef n=1 Tax=Human immunodeficiency virus 2 TaxID=11709 RepID=O57047_9HIV2|nr:nef protein [Human immunodeficiency virus 2]